MARLAGRRSDGRAITVIDVAEQAGVSLATVSRVLNKSESVSQDRRENVLAAMQALGYRPNTMAQSLRRGQSNTVALLVGDIAQRHFAELTPHIQQAVEDSGHDLTLVNLGHQHKRLQDFLARAPSLKLRGIVLALSDALPSSVFSAVPALVRAGVAVASIGQDLTRRDIPSITHEERQATRRSVEYLLHRGHRRIAYVGRIRGSAIGTERFRGWRDAVRKAGVYDDALVWDLGFRYAAGHEAVLGALERGVAFTAVQAGSDEMAVGVIAALKDRGLDVPRDVAVVGFGDIDVGRYLRPGLTTLGSSLQSAAGHLGALLRGDMPRTGPPLLVTLPRQLLERGSA